MSSSSIISSTTSSTTPPASSEATSQPGALRRTLVVAAGVVALALPTIFTLNISRMLLTGVESEHRFHQATGQGLLLCALWLGSLVPLVVAGWQGRRPSTAAGYRHLALLGVGGVAAAVAPQGGAPALMAVLALPGALLWLTLPRRPRLRARAEVHPFLLPLALVVTALLAPYAVDQIGLQHAATGSHADNPHFFDMAWVSGILVTLALLAALVRPVRSLGAWAGGGCVTIGAAGLAFGEPVAWSVGVLVAGTALLAATVTTRTSD